MEQQKNVNTKRKTRTDMRTWNTWCESVGEKRSIGDIDEEELDRLLGHFFAGIRKKDGTLYEPDTLSSIQRSIDRHLTQELHKKYSILRDPQFSSSRQALKATRKFLRSQGKGNKPNASEGLQSTEIEQLWERGALGDTDPQTLQHTIWWLISTHMGTRGCDEHHKFRFGDFVIRKSPHDSEFVELCGERGTKTRSGETEKSTNSDARSFNPKMWALSQKPARCPVRLFRLFVSKRPPEMCLPDSPLYLAVNHKHTSKTHWYKRSRLGVHMIDGIMKKIAAAGGLTGRKTNHCARKTMVTTLCQNDTPDSTVMQLTGHKSVQSLNHYKVPSLRQQESLSHLLSNSSPVPPTAALVSSPSPSPSTSRAPLVAIQQQHATSSVQHSKWSSSSSAIQGMFTGSTFSSCTLNISFGNTDCQKPRKRPRVIYSDSDSD